MSSQPSSSPLNLSRLIESMTDLTVLKDDARLTHMELSAGEVLFRQGDPGDSMYILVAGILGVRVQHEDGTETEINRLAPGAIVGEMALLSGLPRNATVYAVNPAGLIRLDRQAYDQLVQADPENLEVVQSDYTERWQNIQLSRILKNLLGDVDLRTIHILQRRLEWVNLGSGDVLFEQGDRSEDLYVLVSGKLKVVHTAPDGTESELSEIRPGETVGEFALFTGEPRIATVFAMRDSKLARIPFTVFESLVETNPGLMQNITRFIIERQQRLLGARVEGGKVIGLLPLGENVRVEALVARLIPLLEQRGQVGQMDSTRLAARIGTQDLASLEQDEILGAEVASQLDEFERNCGMALYLADPAPTAWTRRCLSHVDRVLLVAEGGMEPAVGEMERILGELPVPVSTSLILLYPAGAAWPRDAGRWLKGRRLGELFLVREGVMEDLLPLVEGLLS